MPDPTITATDQSLNALLRTEVDFPRYALDLCSGYVSTDGVLLLKRMYQVVNTPLEPHPPFPSLPSGNSKLTLSTIGCG